MSGDIDTTSHGDRGLAMLFRRASRLMARVYHRRDHAHHAQRHVLSLILEKGPMPQADLLEILDVRSSSLSEVLRKLERNGLIVRERNEKDRRSFIVSATEQAGRLDDFREEAAENADGLFACLDKAERESLAGILTKIIASLQDDPLCREPGFGRDGQGRGKPGKGRGRGKNNGRGRGRGRGFDGRRSRKGD